MSHGGQTGFTPPAGVSIEQVPEGETLLSLAERGELDAIMPSPYRMASTLNKTELSDLSRSPRTRLLFDDPVAEGVRFFRKYRFSHINHTIVVQDRVLTRHPWVASSLFNAFVKAKEIGYSRMDALLRSSLMAAFGVLEGAPDARWLRIRPGARPRATGDRRAVRDDAQPAGLDKTDIRACKSPC